MNTVGLKIKQMRELKGFSQENMANELGLTQPSYARLEKEDDRISITRLIQISNVLETTVSELINEKAAKVINQQNSENPNASVDVVINADKEHINSLRNEIDFLRNLLKNQEKHQ
jgi:transcriptional regulator with XRE-family HTH domain